MPCLFQRNRLPLQTEKQNGQQPVTKETKTGKTRLKPKRAATRLKTKTGKTRYKNKQATTR